MKDAIVLFVPNTLAYRSIVVSMIAERCVSVAAKYAVGRRSRCVSKAQSLRGGPCKISQKKILPRNTPR